VIYSADQKACICYGTQSPIANVKNLLNNY